MPVLFGDLETSVRLRVSSIAYNIDTHPRGYYIAAVPAFPAKVIGYNNVLFFNPVSSSTWFESEAAPLSDEENITARIDDMNTEVVVPITSADFDYNLTGYAGKSYEVTVHVEQTGAPIAMAEDVIMVKHYSATFEPDMTLLASNRKTDSGGTEIDLTYTVAIAGTNFGINVKNANGGEMKLSIRTMVEHG